MEIKIKRNERTMLIFIIIFFILSIFMEWVGEVYIHLIGIGVISIIYFLIISIYDIEFWRLERENTSNKKQNNR